MVSRETINTQNWWWSLNAILNSGWCLFWLELIYFQFNYKLCISMAGPYIYINSFVFYLIIEYRFRNLIVEEDAWMLTIMILSLIIISSQRFLRNWFISNRCNIKGAYYCSYLHVNSVVSHDLSNNEALYTFNNNYYLH